MSKRVADESAEKEPTARPPKRAAKATPADTAPLTESEVFAALLSGISAEEAATVVLKNCSQHALLALTTLQREVAKKEVPSLENGGAVVGAFLQGEASVRAAALMLLRADPNGGAVGPVEEAMTYALALCKAARPEDDNQGVTPLTGDALLALASALTSRKDWPDGAAIGTSLRETLDKVALQGAPGAFEAATAAVRAGDCPKLYVDIGLDWLSLHTTCSCGTAPVCATAAAAAAFLLAQSKKKATGAGVLDTLRACGAARKLARVEGRCPEAKALKELLHSGAIAV